LEVAKRTWIHDRAPWRALVTAITHKTDVDSDEVYAELPEKYRPSASERAEMESVMKQKAA
jgi:hypothetical protein